MGRKDKEEEEEEKTPVAHNVVEGMTGRGEEENPTEAGPTEPEGA